MLLSTLLAALAMGANVLASPIPTPGAEADVVDEVYPIRMHRDKRDDTLIPVYRPGVDVEKRDAALIPVYRPGVDVEKREATAEAEDAATQVYPIKIYRE